jgi:hypothetical protein
MTVSKQAILRLKSSVESLRGADYKSWPRHISKVARILNEDTFSEVTSELVTHADLSAWTAKIGTSSGMGGSDLYWPTDVKESLGLGIELIRHFDSDDRSFLQIGHRIFSNRKFDDDIRDVVNSIIIPFFNDFSEYLEDSGFVGESPAQGREIPITKRVFLVHGRDGAIKNEVARFLEKLGLEVVILHERPNKGRTLITKFQEESSDVSFAIVLVTPDDMGGLADGDAQPRARQNVVFELGFFIGRLGPERVCALMADGVEKPSDYDGVAYVPLDPNGGWKSDLTRELAAARIPVDFSKAFGS